MTRLPLPVLIIAAGLVLIVILIIVGTLLGSKKSSTTGLSDVLGQAQEINRISQVEGSKIQDPAVLSLLNTVELNLTSDQMTLKKYMTAKKYAVDQKKIDSYQNSQTDTQMDTAAQNNKLDETYLTYIRSNLAIYANNLKTTYASTSDAGLKKILKDAYESVQTLLAANPLNTLSGS